MDKARFKKVVFNSLYLPIAGMALGMITGAIIYMCWNSMANPVPVYEAFSEYYIDFAWNENTKTTYDYYNAYTWNDIIDTDPIVDRMDEGLGQASPGKEYLRAATTAELPSDIRVIHTTVMDEDAEKCELMRTALENAIVDFALNMEEFREIRVIRRDEVRPVEIKNRLVTAAVSGFACGIIISIFLFLILYCLDDRVIMPSDIRSAAPNVPCLGSGDTAAANIEILEKKYPDLVKIKLDRASCRNCSYLEMMTGDCENFRLIAALPGSGKSVLRSEDLTSAVEAMKLRGAEILGVYMENLENIKGVEDTDEAGNAGICTECGS